MSYHLQLASPDEQNVNLNLWSKPEFMQAASRLHKAEPFHLLCWKGDQLVGLLPVYERKLLSYRTVCAPTGSYYQGLNTWLEDKSSYSRQLLDSLKIMQEIAKYLVGRYRKVHFNLSPDTIDVRGFTWEKLKARPLYTFVHDFKKTPKPLTDETKKIALARKQAYHFTEGFHAGDFITLFKAMNNRKNRNLGFSYENFARFITKLHELGILRQFNLFKDDRIVSSNILLMEDSGKAFTVFRATDSEALRLGASSLHTLELIKSLNGEVSELDFCGANVPEVARFKAALGFTLKVFYQIGS